MGRKPLIPAGYLAHSCSAKIRVLMDETPKSPAKERAFSCTPYLDVVYFCYSPVYQMTQYYREGTFDNCKAKWTDLFDCFSLKTKPTAEAQAILKKRKEEKPHIWEFRTPEEASQHWNAQYKEQA